MDSDYDYDDSFSLSSVTMNFSNSFDDDNDNNEQIYVNDTLDDSLEIYSVASDYSSGSTEIIFSDVVSVISDSSVEMSDVENEEHTGNDNNEFLHSYSLRSRRRNDGNVAPIPPSRISDVNSDTEMESINGDNEVSSEEENELNQNNSVQIIEDGLLGQIHEQQPLSQNRANDNNIREPAPQEINLMDDSPRRAPLSEIAASQQVPDQLKTPVKSKENDNSPKAKKNRSSPEVDEGDDGMTCSVCLDVFTNSGPHRLVSLRCGHLFGNSCVERWLKSGCMGGTKRCPTCNKKANLRDIRVIYARRLQAIDTSEKDRIQMELDKVKEEKSRLEIDLTKMKMSCDMQKNVIDSLKERILYLESIESKCLNEVNNLSQRGVNNHNSASGRIALIGTIDLKKSGCCRVLGFSQSIGLLVATQKSSVSLFPGFGIRKIDTLDLRPTTFVNLHSNAIRDLAFHSQDVNVLLSVSLDKTVKIFDNVSNCVVQTHKGDNLLWSCTWDASNPHRFMTGSQNGVVTIYDKRQCNEPVSTCVTDGDTTPVVSLSSIPPTGNTVLPQGGFLSCRLNAVYAYGNPCTTSKLVMLDGPFISMNYNAATQLILGSTRPSSRYQNARHMLHQLAAPGDQNFCNNIHVFTGGNSGQLMSRSCQLVMPDDDVWVAAHNESKSAVELLSVNKNEAVNMIPVAEPIIDLCPLKVNDSCFLGSLSANTLWVHKIY